MIHTLLIANRGEIALRVLRTCREMGIRAIAVYSDADRDSPLVEAADLAVRVGASPPAESYLDGERLVAIAVDALREQQEIVVKSLGSYIGQADNIAGASILGDGQVVLILDVASLVKEATHGNRRAKELERSIS